VTDRDRDAIELHSLIRLGQIVVTSLLEYRHDDRVLSKIAELTIVDGFEVYCNIILL
jgi:hypothetical protein